MSGSGGSRDDRFGSSPSSSGAGAPGSGSAGHDQGGGGDPCSVTQRAPLNSPRPALVSTLSVGQLLEVRLSDSSGRPILEVVAPGGVAGALTHRGHLTIMNCIRSGHAYRAVVMSRAGGAVELRIEPA